MAKPQRDGLISRFFIDVKTKIRRARVLLEELLGSGIRLSIATMFCATSTSSRRSRNRASRFRLTCVTRDFATRWTAPKTTAWRTSA